MKMTELQYASLTISLSTLGQTAIEGIDQEQMRNLSYLLEAATVNVRRQLDEPTSNPDDEPDQDRRFRRKQ
jgi:Ethanolamine utilization protein EutJ (predicted chaperonin)